MANIALTILEAKAWGLAEYLHRDQIRKGSGKSYFTAHVVPVNGVIKMYTRNESLLIVALLHDTLEDCFDDIKEGYVILKNMFGKQIADYAMWLTTDKLTLETIFNNDKGLYLTHKLNSMPIELMCVKLADRLKNIEDLFTNKSKDWCRKYLAQTTFMMQNVKERAKGCKIARSIITDINAKCEISLKILNKIN